MHNGPITTQSPPPSAGNGHITRLRLLRSRRVGVVTYRRLIREHGSAEAALAALPDVANAAGVANYQACPDGVIQAEVKLAKARGAWLLTEDDDDYPAALRDMDDAPPLLWCMGRRDLLTKPMIALVGARNASSLGTRMAKRMAADLADAGYVVVSGLARGIDAAAHLAALDGGTIAVQAGGVDIMYPAENAGLAGEIAIKGLRMSEMPMGMQPQARHFPARNRIIAGLSCAVVVIEAAAKSGSLITARNALDQHRDVLVVPGHPFDARAAGCNMLIRDGAQLVRNAADVIEAVGGLATGAIAEPIAEPTLPLARPQQKTLRQSAALHQQILDRLGPSPVAEDQLIRDFGSDNGAIAPALVDLELDGKIQRQPGGLLARLN